MHHTTDNKQDNDNALIQKSTLKFHIQPLERHF